MSGHRYRVKAVVCFTAIALLAINTVVTASGQMCRAGEGGGLRQEQRLKPLIVSTANRHGVSPALVHAVVRVESAFRTQAISYKGARGLMQLMPQTQQELGVSNAFNAADNLDGGTRYLRQQLETFRDVRKALWAYNTGPGNVARQRIPSETRRYANDVLKHFWCYRQGGMR